MKILLNKQWCRSIRSLTHNSLKINSLKELCNALTSLSYYLWDLLRLDFLMCMRHQEGFIFTLKSKKSQIIFSKTKIVTIDIVISYIYDHNYIVLVKPIWKVNHMWCLHFREYNKQWLWYYVFWCHGESP